jgi:hypothetical protein
MFAAVRACDFKWLPSVKSVATTQPAGIVGATRDLTYADGTVQSIRITEISDMQHLVSYEVFASIPPISYSSVVHTIRLRRVTMEVGVGE